MVYDGDSPSRKISSLTIVLSGEVSVVNHSTHALNHKDEPDGLTSVSGMPINSERFCRNVHSIAKKYSVKGGRKRHTVEFLESCKSHTSLKH